MQNIISCYFFLVAVSHGHCRIGRPRAASDPSDRCRTDRQPTSDLCIASDCCFADYPFAGTSYLDLDDVLYQTGRGLLVLETGDGYPPDAAKPDYDRPRLVSHIFYYDAGLAAG